MITNARFHQDPQPGKPGAGPATASQWISLPMHWISLANGSDLQTATR